MLNSNSQYRWITIMLSASVLVSVTFGVRQVFGLFLLPISVEIGSGLQLFSLAIALQNLIWGLSSPFFGALADKGVNVDMIVQNISDDGRTDMTFSCPVDQVELATVTLNDAKIKKTFNYRELVADQDVSKISVVGIGMRSHAGVAAKMFQALSNENINIKVITTSEIKISVLIDRKYMELAVQSLHDAFELGVEA